MNKRIQLLAELAGATHKLNLGVYQFYEEELSAFVDSIVSECIDVTLSASHRSDDMTAIIANKLKRDYDTQEQCDSFELYLKEFPHGRVQHPPDGAYSYKEEEWDAFQSGWNAAKKHFGVTE